MHAVDAEGPLSPSPRDNSHFGYRLSADQAVGKREKKSPGEPQHKQAQCAYRAARRFLTTPRRTCNGMTRISAWRTRRTVPNKKRSATCPIVDRLHRCFRADHLKPAVGIVGVAYGFARWIVGTY